MLVYKIQSTSKFNICYQGSFLNVLIKSFETKIVSFSLTGKNH